MKIGRLLIHATEPNLNINHSATGVFSSRGHMQTNLSANQTLEGVFVGNRSNNLNLKGSARFKGLYTTLDGNSMPVNLQDTSIFEGAFCSKGNVNGSRKAGAQLIYNPDIFNPWVSELPVLPSLICSARSNFYTQTLPKNCQPPSSNESIQVTDTLYGLSQSLTPNQEADWYLAPRRPAPVPQDWGNSDGTQYVMRFENHGVGSLTSRWYLKNESALVPGSVKVIPAIDCVKADPQGGYTAYLSYTNLMSGAVTLSVGEFNQLIPTGTDQTQPTRFESGQSQVFPNSIATIHFSGPELKWTVGARDVVVQSMDPSIQCPEVNHSPELLISDVWLTETGVSIMGKDAPGSIEPDFAGRAIALTLSGTFKDKDRRPLSLDEFLFTLAPPLVQQTFIGTDPNARILLDESLLLEVVSVNTTEIKAILRTEKVPDFYLKGLHKLSVEQGDWYTDTLIQVGDPVPPVNSLMPTIDRVEVLRDEAGVPLHLRLEGQNFMLYPKFSYATIDGEFGFGFRTEVTMSNTFQTIVHIPRPETFDLASKHLIIMATPFGVVTKVF